MQFFLMLFMLLLANVSIPTQITVCLQAGEKAPAHRGPLKGRRRPAAPIV